MAECYAKVESNRIREEIINDGMGREARWVPILVILLSVQSCNRALGLCDGCKTATDSVSLCVYMYVS